MVCIRGKKVGMTQIFSEDGTATPVTVIHVEPNLVVARRTQERDGYEALVLASEPVKEAKLNKAERGFFKSKELPAFKKVFEVRNCSLKQQAGEFVGVDLFSEGSFVDIQGVSKGKGFQGAMKRHGFSGGEKTHGSKFHRGLGSTGNAATPSRVKKGRKMPGRMGNERVTVESLFVAKVELDKNLLLVAGAVPGRRGNWVNIRRALKRG